MPMTPDEIKALAVALAAELATAIKPVEAETEIELSPDACGSAVKARMDEMQTKFDAVSSELAAMKAEKEAAAMKADAQTRADALGNLGLTVEGFDAANPTREGIAKADAAILAHASKRTTRASSPFGSGALLDPPKADKPATTSTHFAI